MAQVVVLLPSKHEALVQTSVLPKINKQKLKNNHPPKKDKHCILWECVGGKRWEEEEGDRGCITSNISMHENNN
jgi:hypothetical protein